MRPVRVVRRAARPRGFTLIEILIVVVILAALAAIALPQFSAASNDARRSNVQSTVQTLRSQIALYRLQHNDRLPYLIAGWDQMVNRTDCRGATDPRAGTKAFGPYLQDAPINPLNGRSAVTGGDGSAPSARACGYVYDYANGSGSGRIWGTDVDGKVLVP